MKKIKILIFILMLMIHHNVNAVTTISMEKRPTGEISHKPSRAPSINNVSLIAIYDDVTSELLFRFTDSNLPFDYSIIKDNGGVISGAGVFNEHGEFSIAVDGLNAGRHFITVQIGSMVFEGVLNLE